MLLIAFDAWGVGCDVFVGHAESPIGFRRPVLGIFGRTTTKYEP
jgi:hypothetical protein